MKSLKSTVRPLAIIAAMAVAFGACDEQINGGAACPALCPGQQIELKDTTFFAVAMDTSIAGFPGLAAEPEFFLATMGDTLETAVVIRFDSLPNTFRRTASATDSVIMAVDSAYMLLTIFTGDTLGLATTVDVYDVDLDGAEETDPEAIVSAMTPDNLIGTRTIPADSLRDSLRIPIDNAALLEKIQIEDHERRRLRVGLRIREGGARKMRITSFNGGAITQLIFRPSTDPEVPKINHIARSKTPEDNATLARDFTDYLVVAKAPPEPPADAFRVGGLPGRRSYMRFDIPSSILDSSSVVRATLQMTQRPARFSPESSDTVTLGHFGVVASPAITDLTRALTFLTRLSASDTLSVVPTDSAVREFEIINWVRIWKGTTASKTPRALAFRLQEEGQTGSVVDFFSMEAAEEVRPRLRITYLPKSSEVP